MELKKYLLAGGLASVMVLGACGGGGETEEDPAAEDPAMEEGAEDPATEDPAEEEEEEEEEEDSEV